jgi:hypothetical protein
MCSRGSWRWETITPIASSSSTAALKLRKYSSCWGMLVEEWSTGIVKNTMTFTAIYPELSVSRGDDPPNNKLPKWKPHCVKKCGRNNPILRHPHDSTDSIVFADSQRRPNMHGNADLCNHSLFSHLPRLLRMCLTASNTGWIRALTSVED